MVTNATNQPDWEAKRLVFLSHEVSAPVLVSLNEGYVNR